MSAQVAEARLGSRARKLAAEVSALAPWWGDRLRVLVMDARVNRTISGLATTFGFRIGRVAHHPAVRLELSREHAVVAVPAAPKVEAASVSLPRRGRAGERPGLRLLARRQLRLLSRLAITLGKAYHLINLPKGHPGLFIYLVLDKSRANLAMARHKLASLSTQIEI